MSPFLKYPGCKQKIAPTIVQTIKENCSYPIKRVVEPFAGSCAVSLAFNAENYWINDINKELINCYEYVISNNHLFIDESYIWFKDKYNDKEKYYHFRTMYNNLSINNEEEKFMKAILFLWLNKHCFNGLVRFNKSNNFNVPFGKYNKINFPLEAINQFYNHFNKSRFTSLPFEQVFDQLEPNDVVYCDPPYIAPEGSVGFTNYYGKWTKENLLTLLEKATEAREKGIMTVISNHHSEGFEELTKGCKKYINVFTKRTISRDINSRKYEKEALVVF